MNTRSFAGLDRELELAAESLESPSLAGATFEPDLRIAAQDLSRSAAQGPTLGSAPCVPWLGIPNTMCNGTPGSW